ncbi:MAG: FCD domain-containing protein [Fusobacteriaceae bacterium]
MLKSHSIRTLAPEMVPLKIGIGWSIEDLSKSQIILFSLLDKHHNFLFEKLGPSGGIKDHKLILEALKNRDGELAALYMRRHLKRTENDLKNK